VKKHTKYIAHDEENVCQVIRSRQQLPQDDLLTQQFRVSSASNVLCTTRRGGGLVVQKSAVLALTGLSDGW
jgi:hypothetical protein